jgi:hypothetical protein
VGPAAGKIPVDAYAGNDVGHGLNQQLGEGNMKFRLVEEQVDGVQVLCPYVVCSGCGDVIRAGEGGMVVWDWHAVGDIDPDAYHTWRCDPGKGRWRKLNYWILQVMANSVEGEARSSS